MTPTLYRINPPTGVKAANVREEASTSSRVVITLERGQLLTTDPDRTQDGEWLPVVFVRGWVHTSIVSVLDG